MYNTIKKLGIMLRNKKAHNIREYTKGEIQAITSSLDIDILSLLNYLIDIALSKYDNEMVWGKNDSPLQKIQIVLSARKESIGKGRQERCSLQEFEQLAHYLKISRQELLERLVTSLFDTYEENVKLIETIEGMKDRLYVMQVKNNALQKELDNRIDATENVTNVHKRNPQAELVRQGITPARKSNVSLEVINRLKQQGLSNEDIAARLGVSRSTIWRRVKEGSNEAAKAAAQSREKIINGVPF